jgi:hypothetical protein
MLEPKWSVIGVEIPNYIEVARAAHDLSDRLGRDAFSRAERLAEYAAGAGDVEATTFWKAVALTLKHRSAESES